MKTTRIQVFSFSRTQFLINDQLSEILVVPAKNCYWPKILNLETESMSNIIAFLCIQYQNDNELNLRFFKFEFHLNFFGQKCEIFWNRFPG